jgi:hypothetical protein
MLGVVSTSRYELHRLAATGTVGECIEQCSGKDIGMTVVYERPTVVLYLFVDGQIITLESGEVPISSHYKKVVGLLKLMETG